MIPNRLMQRSSCLICSGSREYLSLQVHHFLGRTPAAVAPEPAAGLDTAAAAFLRLNNLEIRFVMGKTVQVANHGVPHTLKMRRRGSSAFVTAYAVANSTTILVPVSPLPNHRPPLASSFIQPFLRMYLPNFSTPSLTHLPSLMKGGSQLA